MRDPHSLLYFDIVDEGFQHPHLLRVFIDRCLETIIIGGVNDGGKGCNFGLPKVVRTFQNSSLCLGRLVIYSKRRSESFPLSSVQIVAHKLQCAVSDHNYVRN